MSPWAAEVVEWIVWFPSPQCQAQVSVSPGSGSVELPMKVTDWFTNAVIGGVPARIGFVGGLFTGPPITAKSKNKGFAPQKASI